MLNGRSGLILECSGHIAQYWRDLGMRVMARPIDPKQLEEGWTPFARESMFTRMVLAMRISRQKFKESKQQALLDKTRHVFSEEQLEEMERITLHDKLTGLYNARTFLKKLQYELKRAKRYKRPLSLLVMSVDQLDAIGRQYGVLTIDNILRAAASIIQSTIRDVDIAARWGRDQFGIIFPETYSSRAIVVGKRIQEKAKTEQITEDLKSLRMTVSVGIVSFPTHARNENDLLAKAFEFLTVAQQQGGDLVIDG